MVTSGTYFDNTACKTLVSPFVGVWGGVCVCVWGGVRMFMLSNEDTYMNFNLNTVDVPSNEDGPRSSDIGNDFNIT